jgi:hypothetical protein
MVSFVAHVATILLALYYDANTDLLLGKVKSVCRGKGQRKSSIDSIFARCLFLTIAQSIHVLGISQ